MGKSGKAVLALACAGALAAGGAGLAMAATPQEALAATPAKVKISSVRGGAGKLSVKVRKAKGAKSYQYRASFRKSMASAISKKSKSRSATFTGLGKGTWYVKARALGKKRGRTVWGKWSKVKSCKVKAAAVSRPAKVAISSVEGGVGKLSVSVKRVEGADGYQYQATWKKSFDDPVTEKGSATTATFTGLGGGTWRVRARAYAKADGRTVWGKWSATRTCRVTEEAADSDEGGSGSDEPAKPGKKATVSWTESTPGWKFPYPFKLKVLNKPYSGNDTFVFLETDAPESVVRDMVIYCYNPNGALYCDSKGRSTSVAPWNQMKMDTLSKQYADLQKCQDIKNSSGASTWLKVKGGYLTELMNTFAVQSFGLGIVDSNGNMGRLKDSDSYKHEYLGTIRIVSSAEAEKKLARQIVKDACDPSKSKAEQMQQACDWILAHSRYYDCYPGSGADIPGFGHVDGGGYVYLLGGRPGEDFYDGGNTNSDNYGRYLAGKKMVLNSADSPALLVKVGEELGYPVVSLYNKYPEHSTLWYRNHYLVQSTEDGTYFECCPQVSTGIIDGIAPGNVPQFDPATVAEWYKVYEG